MISIHLALKEDLLSKKMDIVNEFICAWENKKVPSSRGSFWGIIRGKGKPRKDMNVKDITRHVATKDYIYLDNLYTQLRKYQSDTDSYELWRRNQDSVESLEARIKWSRLEKVYLEFAIIV